MKKFVAFSSKVVFVILLLLPVIGHANVLEDYEESHKIYLAATACMGAYSDRVGGFALDALRQDGWQVESYATKTDNKANARFLLARKVQPDSNQPVFILAVVGTETVKDVLTDLLVDQVYFAGRTTEEFAANAQRKDMPDSAPKVHKGYNQFVQAALAAKGQDDKDTAKQQLTAMLLEHHAGKIYLVGHSMGGAVVTLAGARLVSAGVQPEQIEIITFGAPAVGNAAFRKDFESVLDLTRIVTFGDPITEVLQDLVGGYNQFGRKISWEVPESATILPHEMTMYLDLAIKHYYWNRQQAIEAGVLPGPVDQTLPVADVPRVYIAPIQNHLSENLQEEFFYMKEALQDEYRRTFPGYVIDTAQDGGDVFEKAAAAGCRWVLVAGIADHKIKDTQSGYFITLEQSVYLVATGDMINFASYGRSTRTTTLLQALIHDGTNIGLDSHAWLSVAQTKQ
ncbi:MAG: lipase family protein [Negativicutes bacterium]|nr:lipase family protein [Negativicutes bacterium]